MKITTRLALLATIMAAGLATTVSSAAAGPPPRNVSSDLWAQQPSYFGCGMRMNSDATFFRAEDRLVGHTETRNNCQLRGFHASVVPVFTDANDRVVAVGAPRRFGIEARGPCVPFFGCPSTRVRHDYWEDRIDPFRSGRATRLELQQFRSPNSILESWHSFNAHADEAIRTAKTAAQFAAIIAAAG